MKRRRSPRRRPLQQRAQETIETILRATAQILRREGVDRLTTNRVAERAGVSIGSLYQYFPDKEALVATVRQRYDQAFQERLVDLVGALGTLPLGDTIEKCVRALIALHAEDPALHNAVSGGIAHRERQMLHQVAASWLAARRDELRRPDVSLAAAVALDTAESLIHGTALHAPERLAADAFAVEVTDLLVRYLAK